jgi:hypothetical protein
MTTLFIDQMKLDCAVGAQFIGAPPIYRPGKGIDGPLADKSAVRA